MKVGASLWTRWTMGHGWAARTWLVFFTLLVKTALAFTQKVDYFDSCEQEISIAEEDPVMINIVGEKWASGNSCSLIFAASRVEDDLYLTFKEYNISSVCDTVSLEVDTRSKYIFYTKKTIYDCSYKPFVGPIADRWERYTRLRITRNSTEDVAFRIVLKITTYDLPDIVFPHRKMSITEGTIASVVIGVVGFIIIVSVTAFIVALARTNKETKQPRNEDRNDHAMDSGASGDMML